MHTKYYTCFGHNMLRFRSVLEFKVFPNLFCRLPGILPTKSKLAVEFHVVVLIKWVQSVLPQKSYLASTLPHQTLGGRQYPGPKLHTRGRVRDGRIGYSLPSSSYPAVKNTAPAYGGSSRGYAPGS